MTYRSTRCACSRQPLGSLGAVDIDTIFKRLGAKLKQEAMARAALQMGISLALNTIPIAGQALSAIYSVVSTLIGNRYERAIQEEVGDFKLAMAEYTANAQARVQNAQTDLVNTLSPKAIELAVSGIPLSGYDEGTRMRPGMGDIWSRAKDTVVGRVTQATTVIKRVAPKPLVTVATSTVRKVESVASHVDSDLMHKALNPLTPVRQIMQLTSPVITESARLGARVLPGDAGRLMENIKTQSVRPLNMVRTGEDQVNKGVDVLSGRAGLDSVRDAIAKAKKQAFGAIDQQVAEQLKQLTSPDYQMQVVVQLATLIRESPGFSFISQGLPPPPGSLGPLPAATSSGVIGITAVGIAAFFFLAH